MKGVKKILAAGSVAVALAGMGHNLPPVPVAQPLSEQAAINPHRIKRRENKKLWQKRRRAARYHTVHHKKSRAVRKSLRYGPGYRPGKLFKGHRI